MALSPRERVRSQIAHRETDRLPFEIRFEGDVPERLDAYYGSPTWRNVLDVDIIRVKGPDLLMLDVPASAAYADPYGSVWRTDGRPYHLVTPALQAPSLKGYHLPSVDAVFAPDWKAQAEQAIAARCDHFTVAVFGAGLWERAWALRGFGELLMDVAAEPDFVQELLARVADHQLGIVERLLELPCDAIFFMDDWGYQRGVLLGAKRWRQLIKPHLARLYERVHAAGKYVIHHCCGSIVEILPEMIEMGTDVLESVQPEAEGMNPYALKRRFGEHLTFWGCLGAQSIIPFGTPDEIRTEIDRLCREMGKGGGYILSPAKPLQPETPTENAAAIVETCLSQAGIQFP